MIIFIGFPLVGEQTVDKEWMSEMDDWFPYTIQTKIVQKESSSLNNEALNQPTEKQVPMCCFEIKPFEEAEEMKPTEKKSVMSSLASNRMVQCGVGVVIIAGVVWKFWPSKQS